MYTNNNNKRWSCSDRVAQSTPAAVPERCPRCGHKALMTVDVDREIRISTCADCQASFGVDDSMDAATLRRLLDDDQDVDVLLDGAVCGQCGNAAVDLLEITSFDGVTGQASLRCLVCEVGRVTVSVRELTISGDDPMAATWPRGLGCGDEGGWRSHGEQPLGVASGCDLWDDVNESLSSLSSSGHFNMSEDDSVDGWVGIEQVREEKKADWTWIRSSEDTYVDELTELRPTADDNKTDEDDEEGISTAGDSGIGWTTGSLRCDDQQLRRCWSSTVAAAPSMLSCACGNDKDELFQKNVDELTGSLTAVTCWLCEKTVEYDVPPASYVVCERCCNADVSLFKKTFHEADGSLTSVECLNCWSRHDMKTTRRTPTMRRCHSAYDDLQQSIERDRNRRSSSGTCLSQSGCRMQEKFVDVGTSRHRRGGGCGLGRTRIRDLADIRRGDHVAWHKAYVIWHHAIVVDVEPRDGALTVIHYSGAVKKVDGHLASVRWERLTGVDPRRSDGSGYGEFYRIDYPTDRFVYDPEVVVDRATGRLGEARYNPLTNNCEHFARWCKTGSAECGQVRKFKDRMKSVGKCAANKLVHEVVASAVTEEVGAIGTGLMARRTADVFGRCAGTARNLQSFALACNVVVNLAIEAHTFYKEAADAYRKFRSGAISRDDFRQHLCKVGCECTAGFVGATVFGIVGQLLIPVPFLGSFIGCTLGNLIGRFVGAAVGKKLCKVTH